MTWKYHAWKYRAWSACIKWNIHVWKLYFHARKWNFYAWKMIILPKSCHGWNYPWKFPRRKNHPMGKIFIFMHQNEIYMHVIFMPWLFACMIFSCMKLFVRVFSFFSHFQQHKPCDNCFFPHSRTSVVIIFSLIYHFQQHETMVKHCDYILPFSQFHLTQPGRQLGQSGWQSWCVQPNYPWTLLGHRIPGVKFSFHENMKFPCIKMTFACHVFFVHESYCLFFTFSSMRAMLQLYLTQRGRQKAGCGLRTWNVHTCNFHAMVFSCMKPFVRCNSHSFFLFSATRVLHQLYLTQRGRQWKWNVHTCNFHAMFFSCMKPFIRCNSHFFSNF